METSLPLDFCSFQSILFLKFQSMLEQGERKIPFEPLCLQGLNKGLVGPDP